MWYRSVRNLVKLVEKSNIGELDVRSYFLIFGPYWRVKVTGLSKTQHTEIAIHAKKVSGLAFPLPLEQKVEVVPIKSTSVGYFYFTEKKGTEPLLKLGEEISENQIIGYLEHMKLMDDVKSPYTGKLVEVVVKGGTPVDCRTILYKIEPVEEKK